jgi:hypothetical protein
VVVLSCPYTSKLLCENQGAQKYQREYQEARKVEERKKRSRKIKERENLGAWERESANAKARNLRPKKERRSASTKSSARERESG